MTPASTGAPKGPQTRMTTWPMVSVVMPVLNEERHLQAAVEQVLAQDYPGDLEVVLAIGPSRDRTRQVAAALVEKHPQVAVVDNPSGRTPDALNAAIERSSGAVVARVDGHAEIPAGYLTTAVRALADTGADNVGGLMHAHGVSPFERAVACAMRSRIGVGNARFHVGGRAGAAATVYLGVFRREALERVGGYDPKFARAQDWEMNHRIRSSGGLVWFTPELTVTYRPRASFLALGRQYFHYGRWRRVVARRHAGTMTARYLAPPVMVVGTSASTLASIFWPPLLVVPLGYAAGIVLGGLRASAGEPWRTKALTIPVLGVMHWAWGIGFLTSPPSLPR
ncbi:MAG: glycosyltransferase family 2 protein [Nostocoides sp.]